VVIPAADAGGGERDLAAGAGGAPSPGAVEVDPGVICRRPANEIAAIVEARGQRVLSMRCTTRDRLARVTLPDGSLDRSVVWYVRARRRW